MCLYKTFARTFSIIVFSLLFISAYGQEWISDISSSGSSQRQILKQHDGSNYILVIDRFDSLKVYGVSNEESTFLHSAYFPGLSIENYFYTTSEFIFLENSEGSLVYNFIDDYQILYPYQDSLSNTSWVKYTEDDVILIQSSADFNQRKKRLIDLKNGNETVIENEFSVLGNVNNYLLLRQRVDEDLFQWFVYNKVLGTTTLMAETPSTSDYIFTDNIFILLIDKIELRQFDLNTGDSEVLIDFQQNVLGLNLLESNNFIMASYRFGSDSFFAVIKKETLEVKKFEDELRVDYLAKNESGDKMIISGVNDFYIYDFSDNSIMEFENWMHDENVEILDNRYLFHAFDFNYKLMDIQTGVIHDLGIQFQFGWGQTLTHFKSGEHLVVNIDFFDRQFDDMWKINLNSFEMTSGKDLISYIEKGIADDAYLFKLKDDLVLVENNIHKISNNRAERLNIGTLIKAEIERYRVIDDVLYWLENIDESVILCALVDGGREEVMIMPEILPLENFQVVGSYGVTDDYVYFIKSNGGFGEDLVSINRLTGEEKVLVADQFFIGEPIYTHNNKTYINYDEIFYANEQEGALENLNISAGLLSSHFATPYDGAIFISSDSHLYRVDGSQVEEVIEGDFLNRIYIWEDYLIFENDGVAASVSYSQDGSLWENLDLEEYESTSFLNEDYVAILTSVETNRRETELLNFKTGLRIEPPQEYKEYIFSCVFKHSDKLLCLGRSDVFSRTEAVLFEIDEANETIEKLTEFESIGYPLECSCRTNDSKSLLYAGDKIIILGEGDDEFEIKQEFKGDNELADILEDTENYYLAAFHPSLGRQILSIDKAQFFTEEPGPEISLEKLSVFPNPTRSTFRLSDVEFPEGTMYRVVSSEGLTVLQGEFLGEVNMRKFRGGIYTLIIEQQDGMTKSYTFVKL